MNPKIFKTWIAIGIAALFYFLAPDTMPEAARRTLFIFIMAAIFWAFEIVPLYATSILVVFLEVILLARPNGVLGMGKTGYEVFLSPFGSPTIILFMGGFILAKALNKYGIDRWLASKLLRFFGKNPYFLMGGFMLTTAFLSMWMSNTATTAMMIAMVTPLLVQLKSNNPFRTALILSIPFASSIGGMATPVGTPPNAIAIGILANYGAHVNFLSWMMMAVPLAALLLIICSILLYMMFPSNESSIAFDIAQEKITSRRTQATIMIALFTIILWLTSGIHKIPSSVIALLASVLLALTGLLDQEDFKSINWDVLILMWGGLALGQGMEMSGLTAWLVDLPFFEQKGFILVSLFCVLAVILSTFMSNTAAANLLIPIVMVIPGKSPVLFAVAITLSCSLAMALPVSTPPNAIAFSTNMLKSRDMIKAGTVISIVSLVMILFGVKFILPGMF